MEWIPRLLLVAALCSLIGCTASRPAPVATLDTTPVKRLPKGSLTSSSYVVKKGDTLYSIAFAAGQDYRGLASRNGLPRDFTIYPGQRLKLKASPKKSNVSHRSKTVAKTIPKTSVKPTPKPTPKPQPKATSATAKSAHKPAQTTKPKPKPTQKPKVDQPKPQRYAGASSQTANKVASTSTTVKKPPVLPSKVAKWQWPVRGKVIRSFSNAEQGNKGLDIVAAEGTPVTSSAAGRVVYAGNALRGYGQLVIIKHSDDYLSAYAHNRRILVKEKQQVRAGQKIAEVGHSDADRNMLHFEIRYQGKSVDPKRYLPRR
ncbi:peptidoglycan DD-metalloendopeptidase family protein [uncultured Ferrimonas sp.]|uniref:peptidoglycan DD-metalloendopeptidase family protein n=1 Tax=uncultured Ferrimonas sp. TaxID=432640 RepID=UPI00262A326F|nr:peptidoglycan DD-metalloendopeptidase family protein [uncultured Ferrimonas sp.]